MVSLYSYRKAMKTDAGAMEWCIAVTSLTMLLFPFVVVVLFLFTCCCCCFKRNIEVGALDKKSN